MACLLYTSQYGAKLKLHDSADPDFRLYAPLFRMEEYKKPEFSVRMDAPAKDVYKRQPVANARLAAASAPESNTASAKPLTIPLAFLAIGP